jgi:hypothetical protein
VEFKAIAARHFGTLQSEDRRGFGYLGMLELDKYSIVVMLNSSTKSIYRVCPV